jgi:diaminopimelate decarboxylase
MMTSKFQEALTLILPKIVGHYGPQPFHLLNEEGMINDAQKLNQVFSMNGITHRQYFAVKAYPRPPLMNSLYINTGCGFDCSSPYDLQAAIKAGAGGSDILFNSNNTTPAEFEYALSLNATLGLDDIGLFEHVPKPFPKTVFIRVNPGKHLTVDGTNPIGSPLSAKYGIPFERVVTAVKMLHGYGVETVNLHIMAASNAREHLPIVKTLEFMLLAAGIVEDETGYQVPALDIGGGIGVQYHPTKEPVFDLEAFGKDAAQLMAQFEEVRGYRPKILTESGRYITARSGILVNPVINIKEGLPSYGYEKHIGVPVGMPALMRHAMYGSYHHHTVLDKHFAPKWQSQEVVNIVGPICENCDRTATQIELPKIEIGDWIVTHTTGAHGAAMARGFHYNGRCSPLELFYRRNGTVEVLADAITEEALWQLNHATPNTLNLFK